MRQPNPGQLSVLLVILALQLIACAPPGVDKAPSPTFDEPPRLTPYPYAAVASDRVDASACVLDTPVEGRGAATLFPGDGSLEGEPGFAMSKLPEPLGCWYRELWRVLQDPSRAELYTSRARRDDLYTYARPVNTHITSLLIALRVTGDLALLDEVDRLAQHMRSRLEDGWRGPAAFDSDGIDGYLNWVWGQSGGNEHRGRDIHEIDEMRTHALVAQFAWAFAINDDNPSPNGVDYAERAAFWTDYLIEHFEAKWRERNDVPWPEFPFLSRPHLHETMDFIRYHTYLYRLTGEEAYAVEAKRLSDIVFDNFVQVESESGPALVTPRSVLSMGGQQDYLIPSTYLRYVHASAVDLHFEEVGVWASGEVLAMLARAFAQFVIDDGTDDFARDGGGGVARGGIPASDPERWSRFDGDRYNVSPYALLSAWDEAGKIHDVSLEVYEDISRSQRDVFIPVAMILDLALRQPR